MKYGFIYLFIMLIKQLQNLAKARLDVNFYNITTDWLLGFIEAEGSFNGKKGEQPSFHLSQHGVDVTLMQAIAKKLGFGKVRVQIRPDGRSEAILVIYNREALRNIIIPLCSGNLRSIGKRNQFNLWVENHFEDLICQESLSSAPINKDWLVGFTDGDGSFYPMIHKASDYKCGYQIQAVFDIAQLDTDRQLLNTIGTQFFNGAHKWAKSKGTQHMRILKLDAHLSYVEPFFNANPLQTRKQFDFLIWQNILDIMKNKGHLTTKGVETIKELQSLQRFCRYSASSDILNHLSDINSF